MEEQAACCRSLHALYLSLASLLAPFLGRSIDAVIPLVSTARVVATTAVNLRTLFRPGLLTKTSGSRVYAYCQSL